MNINLLIHQNLLNEKFDFNAADLLIVPSTHEAFGLVSIEAAACNTPSVVFDDTGLSDPIKHKVNGYVAKYRDVKDLGKGKLTLKSIKDQPKNLKNVEKKLLKNMILIILLINTF